MRNCTFPRPAKFTCFLRLGRKFTQICARLKTKTRIFVFPASIRWVSGKSRAKIREIFGFPAAIRSGLSPPLTSSTSTDAEFFTNLYIASNLLDVDNIKTNIKNENENKRRLSTDMANPDYIINKQVVSTTQAILSMNSQPLALWNSSA